VASGQAGLLAGRQPHSEVVMSLVPKSVTAPVHGHHENRVVSRRHVVFAVGLRGVGWHLFDAPRSNRPAVGRTHHTLGTAMVWRRDVVVVMKMPGLCRAGVGPAGGAGVSS
jgi:hypothetical protein